MADAGAPAFDPSGELLYFTASTNAGPTHVGLDMTTQERPYRAGLYVAVLTEEGASPLAPKLGEEEAESADEDETNGDEETTLTYDLDGAKNRIQALPVEQAQYSDLAVGKDGNLFYIKAVQPGVEVTPPGQSSQAGAELIMFDFEARKAKSLSSGITGLSLSSDRSQALVLSADGSISTGELGEAFEAKPLNTGDMQLWIDPRKEWRQIFDDVWRMEAEYFYDPDMHGLDWQGVYDRYLPLLDHVGRREDLNRLLGEMIAEMQVGHNRVGGGDVVRASGPQIGLLGANFAVRNGRHQITRIFTGENWNPYIQGPLSVPGIGVDEGDYVLAINGRTLGPDDNIYEHMAGNSG